MTRLLSLALLAAVALPLMAADAPKKEEAWAFKVPLGLKEPDVPEENPMSAAKVELGKALYFDKRLSKDGTVSCATCHDPAKGWTDQAPVSTGIKGQKGGVSAPTVLNAAYMDLQFWDGRAPSLEEQAKGPIQNPIEMGNTHENAIKTLKGIKGYSPLFARAFGDAKIDIDRVAKAIAAFERTVLTGNAPYDRYQAGDKTAMSESAVRGRVLFEGKGGCQFCHDGFNFSNSDFHNIGVGMKLQTPPDGRFGQTKEDRHRGAFKTPTLRNLASTAPYMHDGSEKTLRDVVEYYNRGGEPNKWLDGRMKKLDLSKAEVDDLVAFLDALNGDPVAIAEPKLPQ